MCERNDGSFRLICKRKSDVDILVESNLRGLRFVGLIEDIRDAVDKEVDVFDVIHIEKGSRIESEIAGTGIMIYDEEYMILWT